MRRVIVQYRVKPDQADRNTELVRAVYDELRSVGPMGMSYATFVLDDGVSFLHVHTRDEGRPDALRDLPAFERFLEEIEARCDERPIVTELREVDSYRFPAIDRG